jgi:hypothetical protein
MLYQKIFSLGILVAHPRSEQSIRAITMRQKAYVGNLLATDAVFAHLQEFTQHGYLTREQTIDQRSRYQVTPDGLHYWYDLIGSGLALFPPGTAKINSFLLLLRFFQPDEAMTVIRARIDQLERVATNIHRFSGQKLPYQQQHQFIFDHLLGRLQAEREWMEQLLTRQYRVHQEEQDPADQHNQNVLPFAPLPKPPLRSAERQKLLDLAHLMIEIERFGVEPLDLSLFFLPFLPRNRALAAIALRHMNLMRFQRLLREENEISSNTHLGLLSSYRATLLSTEMAWLERTRDTFRAEMT